MSDEQRHGAAHLPERSRPVAASDLEALLFVVDRPLARKEAAKLLEVDRSTIDRLVDELQNGLSGRGITLITHGDELQLTSGPEQARAVLDALLEKYRDEGVLNLDDTNVLRIAPFSAMGSVVQLIKAFGGKEGFEKAVLELQDALYLESA